MPDSGETYHHWKLFSDGSHGVSINFEKAGLLSVFKKDKRVKHGRMQYDLIKDVEESLGELPLETSKLPFLKRYPYRGEKEYRVIYVDAEASCEICEGNPGINSRLRRVGNCSIYGDRRQEVEKDCGRSRLKYEEFNVGIGVGAAFRPSSMKMPAECFQNRRVFAEVAVNTLGEARGLAHSGRVVGFDAMFRANQSQFNFSGNRRVGKTSARASSKRRDNLSP